MNENQKPLILVVEDDTRLSLINCRALESEGYTVQAAFTLAEARSILNSMSPDVILLDVKLPDGSGIDLCRAIRSSKPRDGLSAAAPAHIIFLTSVTESSGEMEGLLAGGDDYLRKPYHIELLRERVKSVLRRRNTESKKAPTGVHRMPQRITKGSLELDLIALRAYIDGNDINLSPKEFSLLHMLILNEGKIMNTDDIFKTVWNLPLKDDPNTVRFQISRMRKKLAGSGYIISAVYGSGYRFEKE